MVGARSDVGLRRQHNEDAIFVGQQIWAVADGLGGHAAGDVASGLVVEVLSEVDLRDDLRSAAIGDAIAEANRRILEYAQQEPSAAGMGSTVAGLALVHVGGASHWAIFNVGDSRVYRLFEGVLSRATVDHSEIEELLQAGLITEEESRDHASRNVITRSIGTSPPPQLDLRLLPRTPGERFLICSDGLTNELTDAEIAEALLTENDAEHAAQTLLEGALSGGGRDNISMIVVDHHGSGDSDVDEKTLPRVKEGL